LTPNCFRDGVVEKIVFESGSQISRLESHPFAFCASLKSISIPAAAGFIGAECFLDRRPRVSPCLATVTFESGSKLQEIESDAFYGCYSLQAI
jgi:hypothetical protein